jgi:hypothetical protein
VRGGIPFLALALFLLCTVSGIAAQDQASSSAPWITIAGEPPYIMPADQQAATIPLLVTLAADVTPKDVSVAILDVRYDKLVDDRLSTMFSVDPSVDRGSARGPSILVKVADVRSLRPGDYHLTLGARHGKLGAAAPIKVTVERPGIELEQPGKQSIDVYYPFPGLFGSASSVYPNELRFKQKADSRFSRMTEATFHATPFRTGAERASRGVLELAPRIPVEPAQPLIVGVAARNFPAGVSTGVVEVRGPDFTSPLSVEVEVKARHSRGWLIVLIVAGLLLGYLLRVFLQRRVELAKARLQSAGVIAELERGLAQSRDKGFSEKVKPALAALRQALDGRDSAVIDENAKTASDVLKEASTDLQSRVASAHERLKSFLPLAAPATDLPPELAAIVRDCAGVIARCAELLDRLDPTRVNDVLNDLEQRLTTDLTAPFARWRTTMPVRFRELEQLQFALQTATFEELTAAIKDLRQRVEAVAAPKELGRIAAALDEVRESQALTAARALWVKDSLAQDLATFERSFIERGGTDPVVTELQRVSSEVGRQLADWAQRMDPATPALESSTREKLAAALEKLLDITLDRYKTTLLNAELTAFEEARKASRYWDALGALPAATTRLKAGQQPRAAATVIAFHRPQRAAAAGGTAEPPPSVSTQSVATINARSVSELARAEGAQTLIAAVLITALGYVLFADEFIGTLNEMATVFLWGFTLDISVSKLLEVAAPLSGAGRQP